MPRVAGVRAATRLTAERTGRSISPPSAPGPVTTNEKLPSKRSITSSPTRGGRAGTTGRIAAGGEHVVKGEGEHDLLAGSKVSAALVLDRGRRRRPPPGAPRCRRRRSPPGSSTSTMKRTRALSVIAWCCGTDDSRSPASFSSQTSATRASPSPARPSLGGCAVAGLAAEVELQIAVGDLVRLAQVDRVPRSKQQRAVAEALQRAHVVGDEDDRPPAITQVVEHVKALLLEGGVADGQHLVDHQDVGVDLDRHREGQTHVHPRGVVLELEVLELLQLGELDHALVAPARLPGGQAEHDPVHHDVVPSRHVGVEADPELDEGREPAPAPDVALGLVDPGQTFEQGALAAAVAAGDPEELSRLHREGDVVERLKGLAADPAPGMKRALLEGVNLLLGDGERLADRPRDHHRQPLAADGWSWHGRRVAEQFLHARAFGFDRAQPTTAPLQGQSSRPPRAGPPARACTAKRPRRRRRPDDTASRGPASPSRRALAAAPRAARQSAIDVAAEIAR